MDFDSYLQSKGYAPGRRIPAAAAKQLHAQFLKDSSGSDYQPRIVQVTNPATSAVESAFMSSQNSAQLMRDSQPKTQYKTDKAGNLLAIEGTSAAVVTNKDTGQPIKLDQKTAALAEALAMMSGGMAPGMAEPSPTPEAAMTNSMAFQGVPAASDYTTNMPTLPVKSLAPGAMGGGGGFTMTPTAAATNAPTPAPALTTPEEVRAAYRRGQITREQATAILGL